ncbi:MAG: FkbM family methyltransferase [Nitrospinota bacterium]|nr:FkbM family methyltransferase [Nitrospinota bacterium]
METILKRTKYLFNSLLFIFKPDLVFDIGSLDGRDAIRMRDLLPESQIVSFEANSLNYKKMEENPVFNPLNISIMNKAVSDIDGEVDFYEEEIFIKDDGRDNRHGGVSSTRARVDEISKGHNKVKVETTRVDSFVLSLPVLPKSIALWIDVEGGSFEVLNGLSGVKDLVSLIHVEVETEEVWKDQKTKQDVLDLLDSEGFMVIARSRKSLQHDIVLVNKQEYSKKRGLILGATYLCKYFGPLSYRVLRIFL